METEEGDEDGRADGGKNDDGSEEEEEEEGERVCEEEEEEEEDAVCEEKALGGRAEAGSGRTCFEKNEVILRTPAASADKS